MITGQQLFDVLSTLGITRSMVASSEAVENIRRRQPVTGQAVAQLRPELFEALEQQYGAAVTVTISIGDQSEFEFPDPDWRNLLQALVAKTQSTPEFNVFFNVDKNHLAVNLLTTPPATTRTVLFFTVEALVQLLSRSLVEIASELWSAPFHRLLILVLDNELHVSGDMISVLGGSHTDRRDAEAGRPPISATLIERAPKRRDEYIGVDSTLAVLTPWHFSFVEGAGDQTVLDQLDAVFATEMALFTCDRARPLADAGTVRAEYRGKDHVAFLTLSPSVDARLLRMTSVQRAAMKSIVEWCYETTPTGSQSPDWVADRLLLIQTRVAQSLEGRDDQVRPHTFVSTMPQTSESVRWQWRAFIEGRVSDYLDKEQKLENVVSEAVDAYGSRTASLIKSLADSVLAAVAVLVGTFIAAAFSDPFNSTLFRIGVVTYAVYLAVFPGTLGLLSIRGDMALVKSSFDAKRRRFARAISPSNVDEVVGSRLIEAQARFRYWFGVAAVSYGLVAIAAVVAAILVPNVADVTPVPENAPAVYNSAAVGLQDGGG